MACLSSSKNTICEYMKYINGVKLYGYTLQNQNTQNLVWVGRHLVVIICSIVILKRPSILQVTVYKISPVCLLAMFINYVESLFLQGLSRFLQKVICPLWAHHFPCEIQGKILLLVWFISHFNVSSMPWSVFKSVVGVFTSLSIFRTGEICCWFSV